MVGSGEGSVDVKLDVTDLSLKMSPDVLQLILTVRLMHFHFVFEISAVGFPTVTSVAAAAVRMAANSAASCYWWWLWWRWMAANSAGGWWW